ncbi:MAG: asparagine synthetase B, partial [Flavihumibacter sp.]|nr:asparagine synthetase B [Flavihumibacter sp.]
MCGIAGIYQFNQESPSRDAIFRMTKAMAHRGPDADGLVISGPVALGHRRLAIIDLSPAGNQPAYSSNGRFCGVFNGEIYNFREIRATLTGHTFKSTGDTEVLMEGWARWGLDLLPKLKGMFSFAILDQQTRELYIVRDRLGVKPLYYSQHTTFFSFASEIRSLLTVLPGKPLVSEEALFSYFSYQSV